MKSLFDLFQNLFVEDSITKSNTLETFNMHLSIFFWLKKTNLRCRSLIILQTRPFCNLVFKYLCFEIWNGYEWIQNNYSYDKNMIISFINTVILATQKPTSHSVRKKQKGHARVITLFWQSSVVGPTSGLGHTF